MSDVLKDAKELFEECESAWGEIYQLAEDDHRFANGDQWANEDKTSRTEANRPALTINRLPQFIHQVTNDIRMNTPSINVIPEDDEADEETAQALKEWIRGIEYRSKADAAYDTAMEAAVKGGIGFIRVDHDYATDSGFEQEVLIKRVVNPFSCYIDPSIVEADGSDAMFGFALDTFTKRQFERQYPKFDAFSFGADEPRKDTQTFTVAEFFKVDEENRPVAQLSDGSMVDYEDGMDGVLSVRKFKKRTVKRYKLSGQDVLEETTFPGIYIPIIPVFGEESWIDGQRQLRGLVRNARDPQVMYNLWKSYEAEILQKSPIAPVMAAEGQVEGFASAWNNPHKSMVLRYKQVDVDGRPAGAPQRLQPAQIPTGMVNASMMAVDDLKATTGIYDASLGNRGNEQSGRAIQARQKEGDVSNFHFADNLVRAIAHTGRVIVGMRSTIIDTPRVIQGMGADDTPKMIGVNGKRVKNQQQTVDFKKGKYGIRVTTGASFSTKRQEAAAFMQDVVARDPNMMATIGDLLMKNMDVPGADAMAERFKMMLPPQIQEMEAAKAGGEKPDPEKMKLKQGMEMAVQEIQQLQQALQQAEAELQNKQADHVIKMKEIELKEKELAGKNGELQIKAYEAQYGQPATPEAKANRPPVDIGVDGLQEMKTPEQIQIEQAEAQKQMDMNSAQSQLKMAELELEKQGLEQEAQIAMAQQQAIAALIQQVSILTQSIQAPKAVVRDPQTGLIMGVK